MSKINVLDSTVFNRIAAGEVVERPCSIVKELLENCIDAGANIITVEIKNGGLDYIRVTDNGCGMDAEDVNRAFLPHATSKISCLDDLNSIFTLGFRGEALTSIASVSKVTLTSKVEDRPLGNYIVIENGNILERGERGCPNGTSVTVENLFKNIPARAKFLTKPNVEEAVITDMMARLIMTNHSRSIKYAANSKVIYQSSGDNLKNAIYSVYGKSFIDNLVPIECVMPDITLKGYVNKPYFTKSNRTFQTLIVNGRYVINSDVSYCIYNCYQEFLMKRQFPVFILEIAVPFDMVDVNVHPNKLEIKFADSAYVKRVIYRTIRDKLKELTTVPKEISEDSGEQEPRTAIIKSSALTDAESAAAADGFSSLGNFFTLTPKSATGQSALIASPKTADLSEDMTAESFISSLKGRNTNSLTENENDNKVLSASQKEVGQELVQQDYLGNLKININSPSSYNYKTTLFDTYILLESRNDIILIDQHAAHERLLYDKLVKQHEEREIVSQSMLIPYLFDVSPVENQLLSERIDDINSCGFDLNKLSGMSYSLSAVPLLCAGLNTDNFISQILNGLRNPRYKKLDFIKDILMQSACKAAVKGEDRLDESEISFLLREFENNNKALLCPHGRPVMIKINKTEMEKWFKRAV